MEKIPCLDYDAHGFIPMDPFQINTPKKAQIRNEPESRGKAWFFWDAPVFFRQP